MKLIIWFVALVFLAFWTGLMWLAHKLVALLAQWPWELALDKLKALPMPPGFADWWVEMVTMATPLLLWSQSLLQGLLQMSGSAMPVILFVVWLVGAGLLLTLALLLTGAAWWFQRNKSKPGGPMAA